MPIGGVGGDSFPAKPRAQASTDRGCSYWRSCCPSLGAEKQDKQLRAWTIYEVHARPDEDPIVAARIGASRCLVLSASRTALCWVGRRGAMLSVLASFIRSLNKGGSGIPISLTVGELHAGGLQVVSTHMQEAATSRRTTEPVIMVPVSPSEHSCLARSCVDGGLDVLGCCSLESATHLLLSASPGRHHRHGRAHREENNLFDERRPKKR